jgi:hypothetical protein
VLIVLLAATGCELSPTSADSNLDQDAILQLLLEEGDFFDATLFTAGGAEDPTTPAKVVGDIVPWRFGRQILGVEKDISISIDNTTDPATASVTWTVTRTGTFHVIDTTATAYSKDFTDTMLKYATFERRGLTSGHRRGWRLVSVSGTEIVSDTTPSVVDIVSINLSSTGGVDTTFTDVNTLVDREMIQAFAPLDTVTITVTTTNTDDVVLLHYPAWASGHSNRRFVRRKLTNNGDGTYTGTWITRGQVWRNGYRMNPPRYITVDVLSNGTVYTDDEPYDSVAWGFVYRVIN